MAASHRRPRKGVRLFATWLAVIGAFMMATGFNASVASASGGNNGTLKVHEQGTPSGTESNDPKLCVFNFEGFGFDEGQTGTISIAGQGQSADLGEVLSLSFGPANADGFYATGYVNGEGDPSIPDGHFKATLSDPSGEEKAKSKVFKITCEDEEPPVTPEADVTVTKDCESITVNVSGVKPEGAKVVITDNGTVVDEGTRDVAPGSHTIKVTVNGTEVFSKTFTIEECEEPPVFTHQEAVNKGSCVQLVPTVTGSTSTPVPAIGYQIVGKSPVKTIDEHDGGNFTFNLPAVKPGETVQFRVVYQFNDTEPLFSEVLTFTAGKDCDEEPEPDTKFTITWPTPVCVPGLDGGAFNDSLGSPTTTPANAATFASSVSGSTVTLTATPRDGFVPATGVDLVKVYTDNGSACGSTPPVDKCPEGTKWTDKDGDGKVDKGECLTPVKPTPKPKPTPDTRPDEVSSDGVGGSSPLIPMGALLMAIAGFLLASGRKPGRHIA